MRIWGYLITWIQAIQMRYMPMITLGIIHILQPLLQLVILTYLHRRQTIQYFFNSILINYIFSYNLCSLQSITQHVKYNLIIHCTAGCQACFLSWRSLFRRYRWNSHQPMILRMFHQEIHIEVSSSFQYRIILNQEVLISGIKIMLPQMLA